MNLKDHDEATQYLNRALDTGYEAFILALQEVVKARMSFTLLSSLVGYPKASLYKTLSGKRTSSWKTIMSICIALGFKVEIKKREDGKERAI